MMHASSISWGAEDQIYQTKLITRWTNGQNQSTFKYIQTTVGSQSENDKHELLMTTWTTLNNSVSACHVAFHVAQQLCVRQQKCKVAGTCFKILRFVAVETTMNHRILPPFYGESVEKDRERSKSVPVLATAGSTVRIGRLVGYGHPYCELLRDNYRHSIVESYSQIVTVTQLLGFLDIYMIHIVPVHQNFLLHHVTSWSNFYLEGKHKLGQTMPELA